MTDSPESTLTKRQLDLLKALLEEAEEPGLKDGSDEQSLLSSASPLERLTLEVQLMPGVYDWHRLTVKRGPGN